MAASQVTLPERDNRTKFREHVDRLKAKRPGEDNPAGTQSPEQIVEGHISASAGKAVAKLPEWRLPADQEEFALMSAEDERQIVLEALGRAPEQYVYCYWKGKELIAGVSVTGSKDLAREKGFIETLVPVSCTIEEGPDGEKYWHAGVRARDMRKNTIVLGFGRQWTKMRIKERDASGRPTGKYQIVEDELAWNKALGKAQRNALLSCLPSSDINAYIDQHITEIAQKKGLVQPASKDPTNES